MKMTLTHPSNADKSAQVGLDRALGWFCTLRERGKRHADYDGMAPGYDGLRGLLNTLIAHDWFSRDDLDEALRLLVRFEAHEMDDPDVARAADTFERLKAMAAD